MNPLASLPLDLVTAAAEFCRAIFGGCKSQDWREWSERDIDHITGAITVHRTPERLREIAVLLQPAEVKPKSKVKAARWAKTEDKGSTRRDRA